MLRCTPIALGQLTGPGTESLLIMRYTGDLATSPMLAAQDVPIAPNGSAS